MFVKRSSETEIMDDLSYEGEVLDKTLRELHFINTWLGGNNVVLSGLEELLSKTDAKNFPQVLKIADLGCGGGDLMKLMAQWARKRRIKIEITGIDANPYIINYARQNTEDFPEISFRTLNVFSEEFRTMKFDIVTCTLFCHHFEDDALVALLTQLRAQVAIGLVINDIHRHWFAYYSIKLLTELFSGSSMVRNDAKVSVQRAFLKQELKDVFERSGFKKNNITWKWAFRFQAVGWK